MAGFRTRSLARSLALSLTQRDVCSHNFFQFDEDKYLFCTTDKFIVNKFRCLARYHWAIFRALCLCAFCWFFGCEWASILYVCICWGLWTENSVYFWSLFVSHREWMESVWMRDSDALQPLSLPAKTPLRNERRKTLTTNDQLFSYQVTDNTAEQQRKKKKQKPFHIMLFALWLFVDVVFCRSRVGRRKECMTVKMRIRMKAVRCEKQWENKRHEIV